MDSVEFTDLDACPSCGGAVVGHDMRAKRFAVMLDQGQKRTIRVYVRRFHCEDCGRLCYADEPFYPGTRLGSPIVDLCRLLSEQMPFNRTAEYLRAMGIVVDRGTVRNYAALEIAPTPATEIFGFPIPLSLLNLSISAIRRERSPIVGTEALVACGFPSTDRTALSGGWSPKEWDQRYEEEEEEERIAKS